jgi:hypothetical protein
MARLGISVLALGLWLVAAPPGHAGGGTFDTPGDDDNDSRATLFGFVKDKNGDPVADAKITVTMTKLNASLVVRSDEQGHFLTKLFYRDVDPDDLDLACAKDGFREVAHTRRPSPAAGAPIEIDCVLDHQ